MYYLHGDRAGVGPVPRLITPFLNEVGISFGEPKNLVQGGGFEDDAGSPGGVLQGLGGVLCGEGADVREAEKPFRRKKGSGTFFGNRR